MTTTRALEKYQVNLNVPQARRYFEVIAEKLCNENNDVYNYLLTGADGQRLMVLLDKLEEVLGPVRGNHD